MNKMIRSALSLVVPIAGVACISVAPVYAATTSNSTTPESVVPSPALEQQSEAEYQKFLEGRKEFEDFVQNQKATQGSTSDSAFLWKCAIEYHNQKVSKGELSDPLLSSDTSLQSNATLQPNTGGEITADRALLWSLSEVASIWLPEASFFLQHSLQDDPSPIFLPTTDQIVPKIKASTAYKQAIAPFKTSKTTWATSYPDFTNSNSSWDLDLSLHRTTMSSSATGTSSGSSITSSIYDTYNFDYVGWKEAGQSISSKLVYAVNDVADVYEVTGVIVPYDLYIAVPDSKS